MKLKPGNLLTSIVAPRNAVKVPWGRIRIQIRSTDLLECMIDQPSF